MSFKNNERKNKDKRSMKKTSHYENFIAKVFGILLLFGVFLAVFISSLLLMFDILMIGVIVLVMIEIIGMDIEKIERKKKRKGKNIKEGRNFKEVKKAVGSGDCKIIGVNKL